MPDGSMGIIRICPGKGLIAVFLINERQISVNTLADIDSMRKILSGCQHQPFHQKKSGVDVDLPHAISAIPRLNRIGFQFDVRQSILLNQGFKNENSPEQGKAHFLFVIHCKVKGKERTDHVNRPEALHEIDSHGGQPFLLLGKQSDDQFGGFGGLGMAHGNQENGLASSISMMGISSRIS